MQHVILSFCFFQNDIFVMTNLHTAFEEDALSSSHPLNPPQENIKTNNDIIEMFDVITYSKVW